MFHQNVPKIANCNATNDGQQNEAFLGCPANERGAPIVLKLQLELLILSLTLKWLKQEKCTLDILSAVWVLAF